MTTKAEVETLRAQLDSGRRAYADLLRQHDRLQHQHDDTADQLARALIRIHPDVLDAIRLCAAYLYVGCGEERVRAAASLLIDVFGGEKP